MQPSVWLTPACQDHCSSEKRRCLTRSGLALSPNRNTRRTPDPLLGLDPFCFFSSSLHLPAFLPASSCCRALLSSRQSIWRSNTVSVYVEQSVIELSLQCTQYSTQNTPLTSSTVWANRLLRILQFHPEIGGFACGCEIPCTESADCSSVTPLCDAVLAVLVKGGDI